MKTIREILSQRPLVQLPRTATALEAARTMKSERVGCVLVTEGQQEACGIFTERDLMTRVIVEGRDPAKTPLEEVMTSEIFVAQGDRSVRQVRREMSERHIRHVPILDGK
ncbi:MAG: CBS domain-containing protein [Planctomycetota bacterium]